MSVFHPPPILIIFVQHFDKLSSSNSDFVVVAGLEFKQDPQHGLSLNKLQGDTGQRVAGF